jgi:drug/metabolite transporter (DMT)-like permease
VIGEFSALFTAILWSGSSLAFTVATTKVGSHQVNITRLILAAVLLLFTIFVFQLNISLSLSQFVYLGISGLLGLVFGDTFLFKSFQYNGARLSMLMMSFAPAVAALLAYFFLGETLSARGCTGIAVTLAGIAAVILEPGDSAMPKLSISKAGLTYGFLGAAGQGAGFVFARLAFDQGPINGFVATCIRVVVAVLVIVPIGVLAGRYRHPVSAFLQQKRAFAFTSLGMILGPYLGITFSLIAIEYTKVGIAATLMATVPIFMLPVTRIVHGERHSWKTIGGAFIAVGGVAILLLT